MTLNFWQLLAHAIALDIAGHTCEVLTESTHSTPANQQVIAYGGSCLQSVLYLLSEPFRGLAWVIAS